MWRPNEPVEEDISHLPGNDMQSKRHRSRRRAWRDGLADQTVVRDLEDARSYRAFERALIASVDPRSVLELALVHRLASLLWRLRRASAIETGLFEIQGEFPLARRQDLACGQPRAVQTPARANGRHKISGSNGPDEPPVNDREPLSTSTRPPLEPGSKSHTIAQQFLRLSNLDRNSLDRVGRYEARLWRQAAQNRDIADLDWEVSRLRRLQASLMTSAAYEGLQKVLEPLLEPYPQQVDLARAWAARDKAAMKRVDELLASAGLTMNAVMAHTFCTYLNELERIERMIASAEARRDAILREVELHRERRGRKLRWATELIEDKSGKTRNAA